MSNEVHYQFYIWPGTYELHPVHGEKFITYDLDKVTCQMCLLILNWLQNKLCDLKEVKPACKEVAMQDWKTPLDQIDAAVLEARAALSRADPSGIEEALCDIPDIINELLDEVIAAQCEAAESSSS